MNRTAFGLLGERLGHSVSPAIHAAFGNADYSLYEISPNDFSDFLNSPHLRGLNVTIPYKQAVIPYCSQLDQLAAEIGSVNTMVRQADGTWKGFNTDAYGLRYMMQRAGITFLHENVVILGNGGVSQTVQAIARKDGAASVRVVSRRGELNYTNLEKCADATVLVNATPVGMYPNAGVSPVSLDNFPQLRGVVELIYNPCRTALIQQAIERKIPYTQGFQMLVAQAKQAHEFFFNTTLSAETMMQVGGALQRDCENIVLIGMPGCGKSLIGKLLGALTNRKTFDTDAEITRRAGKPIPQIFAEDGEDAFRKLEHEVVTELSMQRGIILMTGGGVVTRPENEMPLRSNSRIYMISRDIDLLSRDGRPLSQQGDLHEMAAKRAPLYEKFKDVTINNNGLPDTAAQAVWSDFCAYSCHQWAESESAGHS